MPPSPHSQVTSPPSASASGFRAANPASWLIGTVIAVLVLSAYARSFSGPFVFDDVDSVINNETIRHLGTALTPPIGSTVGGRPMLNLSLAVNYAISGTDVWSYHAVNLLIHLLASLTIFGLVRRTLARMGTGSADGVAGVIALLWALHPLQTEAVTYVVQRAESVMGLFYLLTLYGFVRGASGDQPKKTWFAFSIVACALGMATKEVMVSAPVMVLLYDRTFIAGRFGEALRRRWTVYLGLGLTWFILLALVFSTQGREGSAGFSTQVAWWQYAQAQFPAIVHYLRLCFWPQPLVFDYGTSLVVEAFPAIGCGLLILALAAASAWALVKRPALGFLGFAFFAILAPSSSFIPIVTEPMAEHRMYLPLLCVVVVVVLACHRRWHRATLLAGVALALGLGGLTFQRNQVYRTTEALWADTVLHHPTGARGHNNLAISLDARGQTTAAISHYEEALRLNPAYLQAHVNLGKVLFAQGNLIGAIAHYEAALLLNPDYADTHYNFAAALARLPIRLNEAIAEYQTTLRLEPDNLQARVNLGKIEYAAGRPAEAIRHYEEALRLNPDCLDAHYSLAVCLMAQPGGMNEAIVHYQKAVQLKPDYLEARNNLGNALNAVGRTTEATAQFEAMLRENPNVAATHFNLALTLLRRGLTDEGVAHLRQALRLHPPADLEQMIRSCFPPGVTPEP